MKTTPILVIFLISFYSSLFANKNNIETLSQQRNGLYSSFVSEVTDSAKIIVANKILEVDNNIISETETLVQQNKTLEKRLDEMQLGQLALGKKSLIFYIVIGALALLTLAFLVLFILQISKVGKYKLAAGTQKKEADKLQQQVNEFEKIHQEKVSSLKLEIETLSVKLIETENQNLTLKKEQEQIKQQLTEAEEKNNKLTAEQRDYESKLTEVTSKVESTVEDTSHYQEEIKHLMQLNQNLISEKEEAEQLASTTENKLNEALKDIDRLENEKNNLSREIQESANSIPVIDNSSFEFDKQNFEQQQNELTQKISLLTEENEKLKLKISTFEESQKQILISDSNALSQELAARLQALETEKKELIEDLEYYKNNKEKLLDKIDDLEDEKWKLMQQLPKHNPEAIKDLIENNIESLKIENTKLSIEIENLTKILRIREPEEVLIENINKLLTENEDLKYLLEDEREYVRKLQIKIDQYLDELEKQDLELEILNMKYNERVLPESRVKFDEMELNLIKLEKLNRLKEIAAITDEEFLTLKHNIITQF